jgi:glyoxylase-like metal-dependent hydrolase (beta-lactamase superfamily II)
MAKLRHELRRKRDALELALFTTTAPPSGEDVRRALEVLAVEVGDEAAHRVDELALLAEGQGDRVAYRDRYGVAGVRRFTTGSGIVIYQLAIETFPDHVNNVYVVRDERFRTLYDCGSQTASSRHDFVRAQAVLGAVFGEMIDLDAVDDLVVSHGHIDHFGGVGHWKARGVRVHVHELDARVLTRFEERIVVAAMGVRVFLERSGLDDKGRAELEDMYVFTKRLFQSVPIDRTLVDGDRVNGYVVHHAPGHCPGQVCMQVDDVLLTADHVLPRITPHQSPESITPWTGLDHYLASLEKFRRIPGVTLALPGHEEPIASLNDRIGEIIEFHKTRLEKVRHLCDEPKTTLAICDGLFGAQHGYARLLALEEAAAHVEYLSRRGILEIANLEELTQKANPALQYRAAPA